MQAIAYIKGHKVAMFVDSRSTLNFINDKLAMRLGLKKRKIEACGTTMANERIELSEDFYEEVSLVIQGMGLIVD